MGYMHCGVVLHVLARKMVLNLHKVMANLTRSISTLYIHEVKVKFDCLDSFDTFDEYRSEELSMTLYHREDSLSKISNLSSQDQRDTVDFSGPLISQMHTVHEILERHERHIRHTAVRKWKVKKLH
ncbi:uncharacterized protein LOC110266864 [Arachis ipaensis]|uniref:uncharacterized protein LOC110266864 n=1 Tax=Arachis ipaensis TaxID=130454 RepID=UPI000A2B7308|nr:uncharacterized protein LOC110266864 [Arachis ipaensis]